MSKRPTCEELKKKLAEAEKLIASLRGGNIDTITEQRDTIRSERDTAIGERDDALLSTREIEEAYIESEQNFRNAMDTSPLGVRIVTEDGELLYANQAMLDICGLGSFEELKATPRKQLYTPESYAEHQARKAKRQRGEFPTGDYEISIRRPDGEVKNLQVFRREIVWGGESQYLSMYQDITERKKAEEKHDTILKTTHDGFWMVDLQGRILEVNDAYCEMIGYTRAELLGMTIMDVEAVENRAGILRHLRKIAAEGFDRFETRHRRKNGQIIDVEVSTSYLDAGDGQVSVFVRDITERKRAQERISNLNRTLLSIRNINQLITREKDRDKLIKGICDALVASNSFNSAWIALLDDFRKLLTFAENSRNGKLSPLPELLESGEYPPCVQKALSKEKIVIIKNPQSTCTECPLYPLYTNSCGLTARLEYEGNTYGILCASVPKEILSDEEEMTLFDEAATDIAFALHDISLGEEYKLLEGERLRSAKLESISTLAGGIAHDFNNLLTGIMGNIGLAKSYADLPPKATKTLSEAEKAAIRSKDLTQQLLTFAKGGKPVKKIINIGKLVKESATFALRGSPVKLELSLPDDLWPVEADEGQINQVIHNIVINADEAMPSGGVLNITLMNSVLKKSTALSLPKGNYICIEIQDTGTGIPEEYSQRIFEPYFTTKKKGSGLGLSTAYSIINNHSGYITAEPARDSGAIFRILLPAKKKPPRVKKEPKREHHVRTGGRILVMDDESIIRSMLKNMLSLAGYQAELTSDGEEALKKYSQALKAGEPFDAVIMDLTIPGGMGGKEAIKQLKKIDPGVKAIVSSGYATDPIMSEYKKYGFSAVIAKPYSIKQLEETLRNLLKRNK